MLTGRISRSLACLLALGAGLGLTTLVGCGSDDPLQQPASFDGDVGKTTGSGQAGGQGGQGAGDLGLPTDAGGSGGMGAGETCAGTSQEAKLIPISMFITVDKSGSMGDNGKWDAAEGAFSAFFQDPSAAALNVALRFWPDDGCDGNSCDVDVCAQPQVALGALSDPAQVSGLIDQFASESPGGGTPMSAALGGATQWAKAHAANVGPAEKVVVILVTDGEPNGCDEDIGDIASYAADAWQSTSVATFAVGLAGSNEGDMNTIAQAGGSSSGIFIGNGNAEADLLAALQAIQKSQIACQFAMPEAEPGKPIDPTKVNVSYTPGDGGAATTIGQVSGQAACGPNGGWYYDDPLQPTQILLCDATCQIVQADDAAKVDIVLGCDTKPA